VIQQNRYSKSSGVNFNEKSSLKKSVFVQWAITHLSTTGSKTAADAYQASRYSYAALHFRACRSFRAEVAGQDWVPPLGRS
jgi:hypothetical protein